MKQTAIEEIILGNSRFIESITCSKEYNRKTDINDDLYEQLTKLLNDEQIALLNKLVDSHCDLEVETANTYLIKGVKIGMKLLAESLS